MEILFEILEHQIGHPNNKNKKKDYLPPSVDVIGVCVEGGYASSQLPGREPVIW